MGPLATRADNIQVRPDTFLTAKMLEDSYQGEFFLESLPPKLESCEIPLRAAVGCAPVNPPLPAAARSTLNIWFHRGAHAV